jgi:hypothetical protein
MSEAKAAGAAVFGFVSQTPRCPSCDREIDTNALVDGKYDFETSEERRKRANQRSERWALLMGTVAGGVACAALWPYQSATTFGGTLVAIAVGFHGTKWILRPVEPPARALTGADKLGLPRRVAPRSQPLPLPEWKPNAESAPAKKDAAPANQESAPAKERAPAKNEPAGRVADDQIAEAAMQVDDLASAASRKGIGVVVARDADVLARVRQRLIARGIVKVRIADAGEDRFTRREELEHAEIACVLLDPGASGPRYMLPLGAYDDVRVLYLDRLPAEAEARVVRCVGRVEPQAAASSLEDQVRPLIEELIRIGAKQPDGQSTSRFLNPARERAREIGEELHRLGGMKAMLAAHEVVRRTLRGASGRELEVCWNGIGEWMG